MIAQKTMDPKHPYKPWHRAIATANLPASALWAPLSNHKYFILVSPGNIIKLIFIVVRRLSFSHVSFNSLGREPRPQ